MRLCVVTDIHNLPTLEACISARLKPSLSITRHALNDLCGRPDLTGETLHRHLFEHGGIDEAVHALKCKMRGEFAGLGYSAGGTAIWRAAASGLLFTAIFCVSSTRLRDEVSIATPNHVFFGAEDQNKPSPDWLSRVPDRSTVFNGCGHNYYLDPASDAICGTCVQISEKIQKIARETPNKSAS